MTQTRTGNQTSAMNMTNSSGGSWNLTGAVWSENAPDPITYPIRSDAWAGGCIIGGTVYGNVPKNWTRDQWYNAEDGGVRMGGETFRQTLTSDATHLVIKDAYAEDYEDAYDPDAASASQHIYLDHVHAKYIRDDCIENEGPAVANLTLNNSLFDGCFTAFAERPSGSTGTQNGSTDSTFTVTNSLVYSQPQPLGPNYCNSTKVSQGRCAATSNPNVWLGAHGIWKWSNRASSRVVIRNTIFRLDLASYSSCASQEWPNGTYENVTLVWTGNGPYSSAGGCTNKLPTGVTVTTDVSVWNDAKAAWLAGNSPTPPGPTATSTPTPTPTSSPTSTASPTPTPTSSPTSTASPTPTSSPTPTATSSPTATKTPKGKGKRNRRR